MLDASPGPGPGPRGAHINKVLHENNLHFTARLQCHRLNTVRYPLDAGRARLVRVLDLEQVSPESDSKICTVWRKRAPDLTPDDPCATLGLMACPLCGSRKARRACPALHRDICAPCCGTKRLVEIACPADCGYLAAARAHPPAVVARQQERDFRFAMPMVHQLSDTAYRLLLVLQQAVERHRATAVPPLVDADVADAAGSLASTLETAARGILYDHQPASLPAQRLLSDLRGVIDEVGRATRGAVERDAAAALRRIERAARDAEAALGEGPRSYLAFLGRLPALAVAAGGQVPAPDAAPTSRGADRRIVLP